MVAPAVGFIYFPPALAWGIFYLQPVKALLSTAVAWVLSHSQRYPFAWAILTVALLKEAIKQAMWTMVRQSMFCYITATCSQIHIRHLLRRASCFWGRWLHALHVCRSTDYI